MTCCATERITGIPDTTAFGDPGRLTMSASRGHPRETAGEHPGRLLRGSAATQLLGDAGSSRSSTEAVPSGVRSRGPTPVPPVVTMSRAPAVRSPRRAPATLTAPSGDHHGIRALEAGVAERRHGDRPALVLAEPGSRPIGDREHAPRARSRALGAVLEAHDHRLEVGVPETSAAESSGTRTFVSG